jgi:hypothetical protein
MPSALSKTLAEAVTPGLDPGAHLFREGRWMTGSGPAMTLCIL